MYNAARNTWATDQTMASDQCIESAGTTTSLTHFLLGWKQQVGCAGSIFRQQMQHISTEKKCLLRMTRV